MYKIDDKTYHMVTEMVNILISSKQDIFSAANLYHVAQELNKCTKEEGE